VFAYAAIHTNCHTGLVELYKTWVQFS
jgi:hypothetical protein